MKTQPANCRCLLPLVLLLLALSFTTAKAQWVTIPDTAFVSYLQFNFPACMIGNQMDTTCNDIITARAVNCSYRDIEDLTGIEYFDGLDSLNCAYDSLDMLPLLPPGLEFLKCTGNQITAFGTLPSSLKILYCDSNLLSAPPLLPSGLETLFCQYNQLTGFTSLPDSLRNLFCGHNQITSLPALPDSLKLFSCLSNDLTALPALPGALRSLQCSRNLISVLPALPNSGTLTDLTCQENQLTALPALPNGLQYLGCGDNQITALPALPASLYLLYCGPNQLTNLPVLNTTALRYFACNDNLLTAVPDLPASVTNFHCGNNQLTSLPPLPPGLHYFTCFFNQLSTLPPLPGTLGLLQCNDNPLTILPPLPASLTLLECKNTLLSALPALPDSLNVLYCQDNPNLLCFPELKTINYFWFDSVVVNCLPNYPRVQFSRPALNRVSLCDPFNSNGCAVFSNVSGHLYNDASGNCVEDTSEVVVPDMKIQLFQNGVLQQQTYSGGYGYYSFDTDTGTYVVSIDTAASPFTIICPANGIDTALISSADSLDYDVDFALQCKPGFDIGVWSAVTYDQFFPGRTASVEIHAGDWAEFWRQNCNTGNVGGQLEINFSGPATFMGADAGALAPDSVSGNTLIYNISSWEGVHPNTNFDILLKTNVNAQEGQQVCVTITLTPAAGDRNPSNNTLTHCFTVVNSFDPNDKQVSPTGDIDSTQEWLTYTIRFQNTGTAAAHDIYIDDTLDTDLDESTFQLLAYSHQPLVQLHENAVRFNFPNINLPDSTSDEPNSHGYVQYKVKLKENLPIGTQIENTAAIYFDFNPPVITNTTVNTIAAGCTPPVAVVTPTGNTICAGESITFTASGGTTYAWSDGLGNVDAVTVAPELASIYTVTVTDANGCTASATASVNVKQTGSLILNQSLCSGDSMFFNNGFVKTAGTYADTVVTSFGCDSFVTLILDFTNVLNASVPAAICSGESYQFGGNTYTAAGFYPDTLVSAAGCDSIVTLGLTVHPLPQPAITQTDNTLSTGTFTSYEWLLDGNSIATTQQLQVTQNGDYSVMVTDANGCSNTSAIKTVVGVGVEGLAYDDLRLTIYPNPSNGNFTMEFGDARERAIVITDLMGKVMLTTIQTERTAIFNLNGHASGVYFVCVMTEGKAKNLRLVIVD